MSRSRKTKKNLSMELDWELYPKQKLAISPTHNSCLYGGAAAGGKSHLIRHACMLWAFSCPGIAIYLFRRSLQDLEKSYISAANGFPSLLRDFVEAKMVKIDLNKKKIVFRNGGPNRNSFAGGATIHLCHLQKGEADLAGYEGQEIHALIMDECNDFSQKEFEFLRSRMRVGDWSPPEGSTFDIKGYWPRILLCTNPGGRGHAFFKNGWVDLGKPYEVHQMEKEQGNMRRIYISSKVFDNKKLLEKDPDYIHKLQATSDKSRVQALLFGDWNISDNGIVADSWSYDYNIIEPFTIPSNWIVDRCFDWGASSPYATCYFAEANGEEVTLANGDVYAFPRGTVFMIQEQYGCVPGERNTGLRISDIEIGKRMREFEEAYLPNRSIKQGPADSSIWNLGNKTRSINDDIALGYFGRDQMNPHKLFKTANKKKGTRIEGFAIIRNMLEGAHKIKDYTMERPGLFIFSNCKNTIDTVPTLPRSKDNPDDSDPKAEDHIMDVIRYRLLAKRQTMGTARVTLF